MIMKSLVKVVETDTPTSRPYLDSAQTNRAVVALVKHVSSEKAQASGPGKAKNLFDDESSPDNASQPVWLVVTTKKHITPQTRLKPQKITLPHSLYSSATPSICLITPDPQRAYKDLIAHKSFDADLAKHITRVIDVKKLGKKYHSYESKRQLRDSHDIFIADDRIITYLSKLLGKTFYGSTSKRPIPVNLQAVKPATTKNPALPSEKPKKNNKSPEMKSICTPEVAAREIHRSLSATTVHLSSSVTTAIRVGHSKQSPTQLVANIDAVTKEMVDRFIAKKWDGVRSIFIKGPNTIALPIWLADELWEKDDQILPNPAPETPAKKEIEPVKTKTARRISAGTPSSGKSKRRISQVDAQPDSLPAKKVKKTAPKSKSKA